MVGESDLVREDLDQGRQKEEREGEMERKGCGMCVQQDNRNYIIFP
jgi:hypothetical protein